MSGHALRTAALRVQPQSFIRHCAECDAPAIGRRVRCEPCRITRNNAFRSRWKKEHRASVGRTCLDCSEPLSIRRGPLKRCKPCGKARAKALQRKAQARYLATPKGQARKNAMHAAWLRRNRAKQNAYNRAYRLRHSPRNAVSCAKWKAKHRSTARPIAQPAAPLVAWQAGSNPDLLAIQALVPRGIPGREDVCQSLVLAILEGSITRADLPAEVRKHVRRLARENHEGGGYAVSLSEPRHDGWSWDDILPDDAERVWV